LGLARKGIVAAGGTMSPDRIAIEDAARRIAGDIRRTPLLRLNAAAPAASEILGRALDILAGRLKLSAGAFAA